MGPVAISLKSIRANPLTSLLNIILIAFGTGILTILLLASTQISDKLTSNSKDIDLVVGAKGSPLQLILSSIFFMESPTGNISLTDAEALIRNPMVKLAVPLALGDSYKGFRMAGTDSNFITLYGLTLAQGKFFNQDFEATIGANVAQSQNLKVGDEINGAHGLTDQADEHNEHTYKITGILAPQKNVTDNLVLTNIPSVWRMHNHSEGDMSDAEKEITSLLIQYRSPISVIMFPRMVNKSTNMQAASPALESARLFSLIGIGINTIKWFSILIMFIALISVFVSLYNSLKERKYDLAIMRIMGASKSEIFMIIIMEGVLLMIIGTIIGLLLGHLTLELIGHYQDSTQAKLTGLLFNTQELYIILVGFIVGLLATIVPAINVYRSDISKTLSTN